MFTELDGAKHLSPDSRGTRLTPMWRRGRGIEGFVSSWGLDSTNVLVDQFHRRIVSTADADAADDAENQTPPTSSR